MIDVKKCEKCNNLSIEINRTIENGAVVYKTAPVCKKNAFSTNRQGNLWFNDLSKCDYDSNKTKVVLEVTGCDDCPYCKSGRSYSKDGETVYYCEKGAFGTIFDPNDTFTSYIEGPTTKPKYPNMKCPILKSTPEKAIAGRLNINVESLINILEEEGCKIVIK